MNRVSVFIDGSSLYFGLKRNNQPTRLDYYQLSKIITGPDRQLVKTYYYNSAYDADHFPEQYKGQEPFFKSLERTPHLELRLGKLIATSAGGFKEKGAHVKLASEMIYTAARNFFDTAILITEDPVLASVVSHVKELGIQVEVALFQDAQPKGLMRAADRMLPLTEVLDKWGSQIFLEDEEDNLGNKMEETPAKKTSVSKKIKTTQVGIFHAPQ